MIYDDICIHSTYDVDLLISPFIHGISHSFVHSFIHPFIHLFIYSCIHSSFVLSFRHLFIMIVWLIFDMFFGGLDCCRFTYIYIYIHMLLYSLVGHIEFTYESCSSSLGNFVFHLFVESS